MSSLHFDGVSGLVFDLFVRYEKSVGKPNWRAYRPRIPACRPGGSCGSLLEFQRANRRRLGGSKQESPAGRPAELSSVWSWLGCKLVTWVPAAETRLTAARSKLGRENSIKSRSLQEPPRIGRCGIWVVPSLRRRDGASGPQGLASP